MMVRVAQHNLSLNPRVNPLDSRQPTIMGTNKNILAVGDQQEASTILHTPKLLRHCNLTSMEIKTTWMAMGGQGLKVWPDS